MSICHSVKAEESRSADRRPCKSKSRRSRPSKNADEDKRRDRATRRRVSPCRAASATECSAISCNVALILRRAASRRELTVSAWPPPGATAADHRRRTLEFDCDGSSQCGDQRLRASRCALPNRSSRRFASARSKNDAERREPLDRRMKIGTAGSFTTDSRRAYSFCAGNGERPVSISYKRTPRPTKDRSARSTSFASFTCSGLMYAGVPRSTPVRVLVFIPPAMIHHLGDAEVEELDGKLSGLQFAKETRCPVSDRDAPRPWHAPLANPSQHASRAMFSAWQDRAAASRFAEVYFGPGARLRAAPSRCTDFRPPPSPLRTPSRCSDATRRCTAGHPFFEEPRQHIDVGGTNSGSSILIADGLSIDAV